MFVRVDPTCPSFQKRSRSCYTYHNIYNIYIYIYNYIYISGYTYMAVWVGGLEVWEIRVMCKIDLKNVFFVFCICFIFCLTNLI